ncbi:hypothetical protein L2E82_18480 [Cichorium intybus]|uniref:Uncharacterized protein n=1 Tax=Cichorium intybus TaxID=13427 RepID=A0ACB9FAA0_CICIN|nr:hypothetical protein L2E82_18480 [Cichorium intybus]
MLFIPDQFQPTLIWMFILKQTLGFEPSEDELAASLRISKAELQVKQSECKLAREKLAMSNVSLVMSVAQKYANMGAEIRDIIQDIIIIYWKLPLMVHPDKCPYPDANQAFIKLNKPFKDLQDPVKLKLKAMHEAAQRISMEGDDALLA